MLATVTVFFRDIEHIYGVLITALHFASAIFYPADIIPQKYQFVLQFNPIYYFIEGFRDSVYYGVTPHIYNLLVCFFLAFISLVIGVLVFERNQDKFILHI
jgi:ABC-type polysaccharide/polyol phosphate export permease